MQVTRTLPVRFPHIQIFCNETVSENLDACKEKYAVLLQAATNNDERETRELQGGESREFVRILLEISEFKYF